MSTAKNLSPTNSHHSEITNLLDSLEFDQGDVEKFFQTLTASLTDFFQVDRASIWLFNDDQSAIICKSQFDRTTGTHTSGKTLGVNDYVVYFKSLNAKPNLTATSIHHILDVPLSSNEYTIGVLCLEQVENKKPWRQSDKNLLKIASHSVSKTLYSKEKIKHLETLLEEERTQDHHPRQVAHEINNPLTIILGNAYLLNSLAEEHSEDIELQKTAIRKIVDAAHRIDNIIRGIKSTK
ncbi:GAF domain-containing protein [Peredibacter sp. HCB2-198]|uniref:GAF domain-containing protein n=1 Tax=Peredibacter sp. HCB2-198 TaxID=3383025 RepID=UPI0038B4E57A